MFTDTKVSPRLLSIHLREDDVNRLDGVCETLSHFPFLLEHSRVNCFFDYPRLIDTDILRLLDSHLLRSLLYLAMYKEINSLTRGPYVLYSG